jgi:hypothetical protein
VFNCPFAKALDLAIKVGLSPLSNMDNLTLLKTEFYYVRETRRNPKRKMSVVVMLILSHFGKYNLTR